MNTQKEIFNAKLESIKAQLEDLTKEFEDNYKREKPVIEEVKEMYVNLYKTCGVERTGNRIYESSKEAVAIGKVRSEDSEYLGTFKLVKVN